MLCDGLSALGWPVRKPDATFYVWARVPEGSDSMAFAKRLLEDSGVLVIPGIGYGDFGDSYVRMSLTVLGDRNGERLQEAVTRIGEHVRWKD